MTFVTHDVQEGVEILRKMLTEAMPEGTVTLDGAGISTEIHS